MTQEASFAGILSETSSLVADARRDVALYTLVVGGLTAAGVVAGLTETTAGTLNMGFQVNASDTLASGLFDLCLAIVSVVGTYWLLTRYLATRGRLRDGQNRFWSYLGMAILSAIALVVGFILLVVPGLILLVRWSAASGFLIGSGDGVTGSLGASWHATKGAGWAIFFAAIVLFLGLIVVAGVVGGLLGLAAPIAGEVASAFIETAASALFAAFGIAVFCLVDDAQRIDEVFA